MAPIIPAIIAGVASLASAIIGSRSRRKQAEKTSGAQMELAQYGYQKDLEMWNRMNEYNDPSAQMKRFDQAGLNPMLIYGSGSASAGNAASMPRYDTPNVDYRFEPANLSNVLGMYQDFAMKQAQINNVKAQTENIHSRTITESYRKLLMQFGAEGKEIEVKEILPHQAEVARDHAQLGVAEQLQRIRNMSKDEQLKSLEQMYRKKGLEIQDIQKEAHEAELLFKKYRNQWMKMGVTSSDNVLLRMFVRMMNESGFNIPEVKLDPRGLLID